MARKKITPIEIRKNDFNPLKTALQLAGVSEPIASLTSIDELLACEVSLSRIAEVAGDGGSITTVEMSIGLMPGIMRQWLLNGKNDSDGPYRILYQFYLQCSAKARMAAEVSLLIKNPNAWLDRVEALESLKTVETEDIIQSNKGGHLESSEASKPRLTFLEIGDDDDGE